MNNHKDEPEWLLAALCQSVHSICERCGKDFGYMFVPIIGKDQKLITVVCKDCIKTTEMIAFIEDLKKQ